MLEAHPPANDGDCLHSSEEDEEDDLYPTMDDCLNRVDLSGRRPGAGAHCNAPDAGASPPSLYIGSFLSEQDAARLVAAGITHVLQVAECLQPSHPSRFSYKTVHVRDLPSEDLVAHFSKCFAFIDEAFSNGGSVLVHCMAGVSRSATVCVGYLMFKQHMPYDEAFKQVHRARPWVMPNEGFQKQLQEFERIGYDLGKWKAWRHTMREDPISLVFSNHHSRSTPTSLSGALADLIS